MDSHFIKAIFLGCIEESQAYCLMSTHNQKIVTSQDVVFNEHFHIQQSFNTNDDEKDTRRINKSWFI